MSKEPIDIILGMVIMLMLMIAFDGLFITDRTINNLKTINVTYGTNDFAYTNGEIHIESTIWGTSIYVKGTTPNGIVSRKFKLQNGVVVAGDPFELYPSKFTIEIERNNK